MRNNLLFAVIMGLATLFIDSQIVNAQSTDDEKKFEVGAQFSILHHSLPSQLTFTGFQCATQSCPFFELSNSREVQLGFGGRLGYNLTSHLALEAEVNFFPDSGSFIVPPEFTGGTQVQGLFGAKVGKRFDKVGVFGKARPGFLYASKGNLEPRPNTLCLAISPPPVGCSQTTSKTNFAFDLGGVVEIYPTKRTIIRFDAGDTMIRLSERTVAVDIDPQSPFLQYVTAVPAPAETTHNFQVSIGVGFRF